MATTPAVGYRALVFTLLAGLLAALCPSIGRAQEARITESDQEIRTYPFSDPSPIPVLVTQPEIYPYFRFDGFSHEAVQQTWKVVTLENQYIEVQVLPEVGGKVYGAIDKATGREFVYRNEVLKFRDIAMRGPWTSGGIEFNFGAIGHAPTTAAPVDYELRTNSDGSVSCIVGAPDLPSRTRWQVEIRLPADKAYFETRTQWFNDSPLHQSNYHWLTSAQLARDDLEFFFPGTHYIGHGGDLHPWPVDEEGRRISLYRNNNFGGSKSYHVLGTYSDFYGGYWHDDEFGYGRWGEYQDYPGQKLWIWALSRQGGIWEDLLTDASGQYIESQSGRFFNQANLRSGLNSPFTQQDIPPRHVEAGSSIWFPVREIDGMVDASRHGVLNVEQRGGEIWIGINALETLNEQLRVRAGDSLIYESRLDLAPADVYDRVVDVPAHRRDGPVEVEVGDGKLLYTSDAASGHLERPLRSEHSYDSSRAEGRFRIAEEQVRYRNYDQALGNYLAALRKEPLHLRAAVRAAEICYRWGEYEKGLEYARQALEVSAYHPAANYYYGLLHEALGHRVDAREAFGWAVRDPGFRAAGNIALARLSVKEHAWKEAVTHARDALTSDVDNISALQVLAVAARHQKATDRAESVLDSLAAIDPLNHFVDFERYLLNPSPQRLTSFQDRIRHELPYQTYLEMGIEYVHLLQIEEAVEVLEASPDHPMVAYWLSYLLRKDDPTRSKQYLEQAEAADANLAFPYRRETQAVLEWANEQSSSWKTGYYLGLVTWATGQKEKTWQLWQALADTPDWAPFYLSRGLLAVEMESGDPPVDFDRAVKIAPNDWRTWHYRFEYALDRGRGQDHTTQARQAYERFPGNYIIGMDYARVLLEAAEYETGLKVLNDLRVLPYEGAGEGRSLWVQANLYRGLALLAGEQYGAALERFEEANRWPEHLGVGRPYHPDSRMLDYLVAETLRRSGRVEQSKDTLRTIVEYTESYSRRSDIMDYFAVLAYQELDMPERADAILSQLGADMGSDAPAVQWMQARAGGRHQEASDLLSRLETDLENESDPWEDETGSSEFALVVEIMKQLDALENR